MHDASGEGRRWRDQARNDLAFARYSAAGGFHAQACFASQQAAEKALKAVHYARGARAVLGHSVVHLLDALDPSLPAELRDLATDLDLYYIATRYPNGLVAGTPAEVFGRQHSERGLDGAERILAAVDEALGLPRGEG